MDSQPRDLHAVSSKGWRLRAWDDPVIQRAIVYREIVAMSADELGDMTVMPDDDQLRHVLARALPHRSHTAIGVFVRYWKAFRVGMRPGDVVAVPLVEARVAIGEVTGEYEYRAQESEPRLRHVRAVRWLTTTLSRGELEEDLRRFVSAPGTIGQFRAPSAAERLRASATTAGASVAESQFDLVRMPTDACGQTERGRVDSIPEAITVEFLDEERQPVCLMDLGPEFLERNAIELDRAADPFRVSVVMQVSKAGNTFFDLTLSSVPLPDGLATGLRVEGAVVEMNEIHASKRGHPTREGTADVQLGGLTYLVKAYITEGRSPYWIKVLAHKKPRRGQRGAGTPQGGTII